jgi:hypothetical protein
MEKELQGTLVFWAREGTARGSTSRMMMVFIFLSSLIAHVKLVLV